MDFMDVKSKAVTMASMPTLVLPPRYSEDTIRMAQAATQADWEVDRLLDWVLPEEKSVKDPVLYGPSPFAETMSPKLNMTVQAPPLNILYYIPRHFLKREVQPSILSEARKLKGKWHIRPAEKNVFPMGIFYDGRNLPGPKQLGDRTPVLISEIIEWEWQYRFFIGGGEVLTYSPIAKGRLAAHDKEGNWLFDEERDKIVGERATALIEEASHLLPPAYVADFGLFDRKWAVSEISSPCDSLLYGCTEARVLPALDAVCSTNEE